MRLTLMLLITLMLTACGEPPKPDISLYQAINRGDLDQVKRHVYWKSELNETDRNGLTALQAAAQKGLWTISKLLIDHAADVNIRDERGYSALDLAIISRRPKVAALLIKSGADYDPDRLLMLAVEAAATGRDNLRLLQQHGAHLDYKRDDGFTPLTLAIHEGIRTAARDLIQAGADVNLAGPAEEAPLDMAKRLKRKESISLLLASGAYGKSHTN
ncbi:MAG: ankyrin repeat domain-containing protein [gamma proteobacterium symbiont of Bathyaustriella thionipta]|nr:ankyrin repeat domain-containing protein [gamma proteobacterium symbiont of Bathyaustriella thionipta]